MDKIKPFKRTPRQEKVFQIMGWLNENQSRAAGYFDCGELGILHIYWGQRGWETKWITIEKSPV